MESEIIARMQEGNQRGYGDPMLVSPNAHVSTGDRHPQLNASQSQVVDDFLIARQKFVGLEGIAGSGKTHK